MDKIKIDIQGNGTLTADEIDVFFQLLDKYTADSKIEGHATSEGAYQDAVDALHERFPQFTIDVLKQFVRFKDSQVLRFLLENYEHESDSGFTVEELLNVRERSETTGRTLTFRGFTDSNIETFDELSKTGVRYIGTGSTFKGCSNLRSIDCSELILANSYTARFLSDAQVREIDFGNIYEMSSVAHLSGLSYENSCWNGHNIENCLNLEKINFLKIEYLGTRYYPYSIFGGCSLLKHFLLPNVREVNNITNIRTDIIDLGNKFDCFQESNYNHYYCCTANLIIRSNKVPGLPRALNDNPDKIFVNPSMVDTLKAADIWSVYSSKIFAIGSTEWQDVMKTLAQGNAEHFAGWTDEQIANADYSRAYIDYDIFGCDKSKAPYVLFDDPEVERVLLTNATHANANTITKEEFAEVTDIRNFFNGNTDITSFDEFSRTSVTSLSNYAFNGCSNLRSIKLPKTIFMNNGQHRWLFRGCTKLEGDFEIKVGENATHIDFMFSETNIRSFSFAEGTILRDELYFDNMFYGCPNLEHVDIRPLKVLSSNMFGGCTKLSEIKGIENVTVFENGCLSNTGINADCIKNNHIETWNTPGVFLSVFPNTLTHFGDYDPGYYYTYNHLIFKDGGDGDLDIVFSDFRTSGNVLLLDFPCNTKSFYFNARFLYRMNPNMCVVVRAVVPPTVIGDFNSRNFRYIFVPNESVNDYKSDVFWSSYADKIHAIGGAEWITEYESSDIYASYSKFGVR